MSAATLITDGFGSFGDIAHVVTLGLDVGSSGVRHRRRRRYHVRKDDKLYFFDSQQEAEEFVIAMREPEPQTKKARKKLQRKLKLIKPAETYSVKALMEQVPDDTPAQQRAQEMLEKERYQALIDWIAVMEEEDEEIELLLLAL